jgi:hypothetical protein
MFEGQDGNFDRPAIALRITIKESGLDFPNVFTAPQSAPVRTG